MLRDNGFRPTESPKTPLAAINIAATVAKNTSTEFAAVTKSIAPQLDRITFRS